MSLARTLIIAALIVAAGYGTTVLWRALERPDSRLETARCWFDNPASRSVECYRFTAPESRGTASNRSIRFPVVIFRSPSTPEDEPPVLHLMGGPGQPASIENNDQIKGWAQFLDGAVWARDRDHIVVDTRGVGGLSEPRLRCPMLSDVGWILSLETLKRTPGAREAAVRKMVESCRAGFVNEGIDLAAYDTANAATDLIDLRHALKLPSWSIYGISYGTRLALELIRRDPEGVHAAVLDSLSPPDEPTIASLLPNLDRALGLVYADCAAQPACAGAYPDLSRDMEAAVARLRAAPVAMTVKQPGGTRTLQVVLDDALYLQIVEYALVSGSWVPFLPGIINDTAKGGTRLLAHLAARLLFDDYWQHDANALLLSTLCREEVPFNTSAAMRQSVDAHPLLRNLEPDALLFASCASWPVGKAPDTFREPVVSNVPALLINGAYDTRTPAAYAERQAAHLTYVYRIVLPNRGHSPSPSSNCAKAAIDGFLDNPLSPAPPACLQHQRPPRFMTRGGPADRIERL
ncbi:alpha/beta hydrolase [Emcibacter sp. SYSU 3D8]|uniref:alpha/beta hydrolase n=1 Tax=Emcibacter sp. SYSU 3D8 TaxID=3133969 RepID=UPI0031FE67FD